MKTINALGCSDLEWNTRVDLAAAFQLCHHFGFADLIWTHLSARVPDEEGTFLLNPAGYMFDEITASNLVKVDLNGNAVDGGTVNPAAFTIHSSVYSVESKYNCAMHLHAQAGCAVAALKEGLLPLNQFSYAIGDVSYHDYEGFALNLEERERLIQDLGDNQVMILRNHGTLSVGKTIAEAFIRIYYLEKACQVQLDASKTGSELIMPTKTVSNIAKKQNDSWGEKGTHEWPALLRLLTRNGINSHLV